MAALESAARASAALEPRSFGPESRRCACGFRAPVASSAPSLPLFLNLAHNPPWGGGRVPGNPPRKFPLDLFIGGRARLREPGLYLGEPGFTGRLARSGDAQLGVRRGQRALAVREQLFVEFFAGPQAGELDPNVLLVETRKADHVAREVDDPDRVAHFQDEDFTAVSHQARLQH